MTSTHFQFHSKWLASVLFDFRFSAAAAAKCLLISLIIRHVAHLHKGKQSEAKAYVHCCLPILGGILAMVRHSEAASFPSKTRILSPFAVSAVFLAFVTTFFFRLFREI